MRNQPSNKVCNGRTHNPDVRTYTPELPTSAGILPPVISRARTRQRSKWKPGEGDALHYAARFACYLFASCLVTIIFSKCF